jgi:hypothetical protein
MCTIQFQQRWLLWDKTAIHSSKIIKEHNLHAIQPSAAAKIIGTSAKKVNALLYVTSIHLFCLLWWPSKATVGV